MNEMSTKFQLTADNYYSDEANREYLSVSQFKDFVGTYGRMGCEEMALAKIRGEYKTEPSNAMMIGSYVDSYYEGTLNEFRTRILIYSGKMESCYLDSRKQKISLPGQNVMNFSRSICPGRNR